MIEVCTVERGYFRLVSLHRSGRVARRKARDVAQNCPRLDVGIWDRVSRKWIGWIGRRERTRSQRKAH